MWISCSMTFFWKQYKNHTHILTISNGISMSLLPHCFSVHKMYMQKLNYQVFPMNTSEAFQIWTKCVEKEWEGNRVPLGEWKLDCTQIKEPHNYISHLVWYWVTMFKLNNSNLIKYRNIIFSVSKRYINIL